MIREIISIKGYELDVVMNKIEEYLKKYPKQGYGTNFGLRCTKEGIDILCNRYVSCE